MNSEVVRIPVAWPLKSLCWRGDTLMDWAGGGVTYHLDGASTSMNKSWSYRFDAAVQSPSGKYAVIYERLGTKALLIDGTNLIRELNRSFYHACTYEYPVAFCRTANGRELLVHCPDEYCQLEIEDVITGERLTNHKSRKPHDFFHSRLSVSSDGRWLVSAGWAWHPFCFAEVFDLSEALLDASLLDKPTHENSLEATGEIYIAAFIDSERLMLDLEPEPAAGNDSGSSQSGSVIGVWNLSDRTYEKKCRIGHSAGIMMPVGLQNAVTFYDHPRLVDLDTGNVIREWPEIQSGIQASCIMHHIPLPPPLAFDVERRRFAVASDKEIVVVALK